MSTALPDLTAKIRLDTTDLNRGLGRASSSLRRFGGLAAGAVSGIGFAAAIKSIGQVGMAYQDSLNIFQSVSGANAAQMQLVAQAAKDLGNDLSLPNTSAAGAATAMTELAKAGLSVTDALKAGKGTLQLATAAAISEGEAATIAANALNTFGLAGDQATRVANVLANAANVSSGEVTDFAYGLAQGGLVAKQMGLSLEETAGALALFANNGLKGSDAGTSLKTMLSRLVPQTKKAAGVMADLGLKFTDAKGAIVPLANVAEQLHTKLAGLSQAQRQTALYTIFGSDAIRAASLLYSTGGKGVDRYTAAVSRQGGAAAVAAARSKGLGGAIKGLRSVMETLAITVYEKVAPALETALRDFTTALPIALARLSAAFDGTSTSTVRLEGRMVTVTKKAGALHPVTQALATANERLAPALKAVADAAQTQALPALDRLAKSIVSRLRPAIASLGTTIEDNKPQLTALGELIGSITELFLKLAPVIGWLISTAIQPLINAFTVLIKIIGGVTRAVGIVARSFASFLGMLQHVFEALGNVPHFGWATDAAKKIGQARRQVDAFANSLDRIPPKKFVDIELRVPSAKELAGVGGSKGLTLAARALGGPVSSSTPYLVGERGPELFVPRVNGRILSNTATMSGGSGLSGGGLHIHGDINVIANEAPAPQKLAMTLGNLAWSKGLVA